MSQPITPDYGQQFLLPRSLEEWVPADHPARFLREFVDQLDLEALGIVRTKTLEGRPAYAPSLLLKIWLYGYLHRIRSTRQLEVACREQMSLLWLAGLHQPDHNTLWRFWRDHKKALGALFKRSAQLAVEAGLVGFVLQAVDGTKIQAAASGQGGWSKERLEKLLAVLDAELKQAEGQIEQEGAGEPQSGYRLPEELAEKEALRKKVQEGLAEMKRINREHWHPQESEARRMVSKGANHFAYNAQVVVDDQTGVIVAAAVSPQENDAGLAVPMIQQAQENCGQAAGVTVADSGYGTGTDIRQAQAVGIHLLVKPKVEAVAANKRYHAHHFRFEPEQNRVFCPEGQELTWARQMKQKGQMVEVFRCDHLACPVRDQCTGEKKRRRRFIEIWPHTPMVQAMGQKAKQPAAAAQLKKRSQVVERVFGHIKQHDGLRRWTVKGLAAVNAQWAMLCSVFNLRLLYRQWRLNLA